MKIFHAIVSIIRRAMAKTWHLKVRFQLKIWIFWYNHIITFSRSRVSGKLRANARIYLFFSIENRNKTIVCANCSISSFHFHFQHLHGKFLIFPLILLILLILLHGTPSLLKGKPRSSSNLWSEKLYALRHSSYFPLIFS